MSIHPTAIVHPGARLADGVQVGAYSIIGEHVETTTPWIVARILADTRQGNDITWLTGGRLLRRGLAMLVGGKRDVLTRYGLKA